MTECHGLAYIVIMTNALAVAPEPSTSVDAVIGANVHVLMWRAQEPQTRLAPLLGITQSALSNKLRGKRPWFAAEIDWVARHYHVTRDALFSKLPDLDSNQEPPRSWLAPVSGLESHRAAKLAAHSAVHSDHDGTVGGVA